VIYVDSESVPQIMRERANYYQMDQSKIYPMLADVNDMLDLAL
jgi:hypothetical protein